MGYETKLEEQRKNIAVGQQGALYQDISIDKAKMEEEAREAAEQREDQGFWSDVLGWTTFVGTLIYTGGNIAAATGAETAVRGIHDVTDDAETYKVSSRRFNKSYAEGANLDFDAYDTASNWSNVTKPLSHGVKAYAIGSNFGITDSFGDTLWDKATAGTGKIYGSGEQSITDLVTNKK